MAIHLAAGHVAAYCPFGTMVVDLTLDLDFRAREYRQASYFSSERVTGGTAQRVVSAGGHAACSAQGTGRCARRVSTRHVGRIEAQAFPEADAQASVLAEGERCYGYARVTGTWHQVAYGIGQLVIQPTNFQALAMVTHLASGHCQNSWEEGIPGETPEYTLQMDFVAREYSVYESAPYRKLIQGRAVRQANAAGTAQCSVALVGEPALIRGPRQLDGSGRAEAVATVVNTVARVSTTGVVQAGATVAGRAAVSRGVRGQAVCTATVTGDTQLVYVIPAAGSVRATSSAATVQRVVALRRAGGQDAVVAQVQGRGSAHTFSGGQAADDSRVRCRRLTLGLTRQGTQATSGASEQGSHRVLAARGQGTPVVTLRAIARQQSLALGAAAAVASVQGEADVRYAKHAEGRAECQAIVRGYNQVNQPEPAPADRTLAVEAQQRSFGIERQERQIVVGRASRALAA